MNLPAGATLRDAAPGDAAQILALNASAERETSPLEPAALEALASQASRFRVAAGGGEVLAFLLAFREDAGYASPNFLWFRDRYRRFLYVDRVIVRADRRGARIASALYEDLERHARETGVDLLACEVNIVPPNPASLRFHAARGFAEVGTLDLPGKRVSLRVKRLPGAPPAGETRS